MKFLCSNCGTSTSSEFSLQSGGYWNKYKREGPWGCPSCRNSLPKKCQQCGSVGDSKTIAQDTCFKCVNAIEAQGKFCSVHPEAHAVSLCNSCRAPVCLHCLRHDDICEPCNQKEKERWAQEEARKRVQKAAEEQARREEFEAREKERERRRLAGLCERCGKPLGFVRRKLMRKTSHSGCQIG